MCRRLKRAMLHSMRWYAAAAASDGQVLLPSIDSQTGSNDVFSNKVINVSACFRCAADSG